MHHADLYRSRDFPETSLGERVDPVVHGHRDGPLTRAELDLYDERGFLVRTGMFDHDEVRALVADARELAAHVDRKREDVVVEPESDEVRSVFRIHRTSGRLGALARDPRFHAIAAQILASSVYVHQSRLNFKPAFDGMPFRWHSDFETWHAEDGMPMMRALSASLLLTENTQHNGPLLVIPGSHRVYVRCPGETPAGHFRQSLRDQRYGVPDADSLTVLVERGGIEAITGAAGTVVFFDCNLMHGSAGNITPLPRHNLFLVYNSTENVLVAPFCGRAARPEFLAERDYTPVAT